MALSPAERQKRLRTKRRKAGLVRYDLAIPGKLHRKLRARAKRAKTPLTALVVDILEANVI